MLDVVAASRSVSCFGWTRARWMALVLIARMVLVAGSSVVAPGAFAENGKVALTPGAPGLALAAPRAGDQSMIPGHTRAGPEAGATDRRACLSSMP